jgi:putative transposase
MLKNLPEFKCIISVDYHRNITIIHDRSSYHARYFSLGGRRGSYRTVQRFFNTHIDWINVQWSLIQKNYQDTSDTFVIAGDETTVTKAGKKTFGLDRFYSSLFGKPVPGLAFFVFSLVSTKWRVSLPIMVKQMFHPKDKIETEKNSNESVKKRGKGAHKKYGEQINYKYIPTKSSCGVKIPIIERTNYINNLNFNNS